MKKYSLKPTKKQLEVIKLYWAMLQQEELRFLNRVYELERDMVNKTGIQELEFFRCDGDYVGIGNIDRTMKLIQQEELEKR